MKKIGDIIRNNRLKKGLTQKELGDKVFVTKQAVSKWETGKTLPDIETLRKLCDILEINKDEILGGSIEETKKSKKWLKVLIVITAISLVTSVFFILGGPGYIDRHTQSGVCYLTVFKDGVLCSADEYELTSNLKADNVKNGYKFDIDYGEIRSNIRFMEKYDIECGFINTNNWHNINIRIDISIEDGQISVIQTVSYLTDNDIYQVIVTENTSADDKISVYHPGV